jgi:hypothetical protein
MKLGAAAAASTARITPGSPLSTRLSLSSPSTTARLPVCEGSSGEVGCELVSLSLSLSLSLGWKHTFRGGRAAAEGVQSSQRLLCERETTSLGSFLRSCGHLYGQRVPCARALPVQRQLPLHLRQTGTSIESPAGRGQGGGDCCCGARPLHPATGKWRRYWCSWGRAQASPSRGGSLGVWCVAGMTLTLFLCSLSGPAATHCAYAFRSPAASHKPSASAACRPAWLSLILNACSTGSLNHALAGMEKGS